MLLAHTWHGAPMRMSKPWYDQACKDARLARKAVHDCALSTDELRLPAEKQYESVISRSKRWMQEHMAELVAAAKTDPNRFWKAFKAVQHNTCSVELTAQFQVLRALMGTLPAQVTGEVPAPGVSALCPLDVMHPPGSMDVSWTFCKCMHAHDMRRGISTIWRCLLGVKQGCPLSPALFGLYVDGLERHLLDTAGIDAPSLIGTLVPLLLMQMTSF